METWIIAVISALVGALVGAFASAGAQHWFWTKQHRIVAQESEERAKRERKEQVLESLRSTGGELIEILREPVQGTRIDHTQSETLRYIETNRLRREFLSLWTLAEDVLAPERHENLSLIRRMMDAALVRPSKETLDELVAQLDGL